MVVEDAEVARGDLDEVSACPDQQADAGAAPNGPVVAFRAQDGEGPVGLHDGGLPDAQLLGEPSRGADRLHRADDPSEEGVVLGCDAREAGRERLNSMSACTPRGPPWGQSRRCGVRGRQLQQGEVLAGVVIGEDLHRRAIDADGSPVVGGGVEVALDGDGDRPLCGDLLIGEPEDRWEEEGDRAVCRVGFDVGGRLVELRDQRRDEVLGVLAEEAGDRAVRRGHARAVRERLGGGDVLDGQADPGDAHELLDRAGALPEQPVIADGQVPLEVHRAAAEGGDALVVDLGVCEGRGIGAPDAAGPQRDDELGAIRSLQGVLVAGQVHEDHLGAAPLPPQLPDPIQGDREGLAAEGRADHPRRREVKDAIFHLHSASGVRPALIARLILIFIAAFALGPGGPAYLPPGAMHDRGARKRPAQRGTGRMTPRFPARRLAFAADPSGCAAGRRVGVDVRRAPVLEGAVAGLRGSPTPTSACPGT